ncbi:MAG: hypothetical protein ACFB15_12720 [Cyclobacteriaceae bacterium]
MIKKLFFLLAFLLFAQIVQAQSNDLIRYNERRLQMTRIGMLTLGSWAIGNMAVNGALMGGTSGRRYYFHQMNVFWNIVNIGLAGTGYYSALTADPTALTLAESIQEQHSIEKLLLLNAGLDVAYIAGGCYLRERGRRDSPQSERWKGYGQSLLLQGGFLLIFDALLYTIIHQPSSELYSFLSAIQPTTNGLGLVYRF